MMTIFIKENYYNIKMNEIELIKLGLNKNEAKVYLILLKRNAGSAGELIKQSNFHRNIVYDNLEKLIEKGLVSFIFEGRTKIFKANPLYSFTDFLEREQEILNEKKEIAEKIKKSAKELFPIKCKMQDAMIYRGIKGVRALFLDTLNEGKEYYVFGAPKASLKIMGSTFWENYNIKREQKKMIIRMIFNEDLRQWSKKIKSKLTKIKFLPKKFDSITETIIYNEKVAIIVWTQNPIATLIIDKNLARAYKQYFEILWKEAN